MSVWAAVVFPLYGFLCSARCLERLTGPKAELGLSAFLLMEEPLRRGQKPVPGNRSGERSRRLRENRQTNLGWPCVPAGFHICSSSNGVAAPAAEPLFHLRR